MVIDYAIYCCGQTHVMSSSLWGWKGYLLLEIHGAEVPCPHDVMESFGSQTNGDRHPNRLGFK